MFFTIVKCNFFYWKLNRFLNKYCKCEKELHKFRSTLIKPQPFRNLLLRSCFRSIRMTEMPDPMKFYPLDPTGPTIFKKSEQGFQCQNVNKAVYFFARFFRVNLVVCFDSILPKYTSAFLFSKINPSSERHRELFVGCWSLMTSMGRNSHCNCPGLNNSLWWRSKLNIKKWNAILYKTNTYIFALRKTTTTQLTVNNIFISILFDFRIWIIQPGTVAMAISAHGSH
jgi:hypothetical protein